MFFNTSTYFIALRYLKPSKDHGMVSIISLFSFLGIVLGVGTLIIVMSVMNGFRTELTEKILGFNPHITIKPYSNSITENFYSDIKNKYKKAKVIKSLNGEFIFTKNAWKCAVSEKDNYFVVSITNFIM